MKSFLILTAILCGLTAATSTSPPTGPIIGIDLGTTYSCVAVQRDCRTEIIPNDQGNRITPSQVAFVEATRLVGDAAKNQATLNPTNTIFDAKRIIGRKWNDPAVVEAVQNLPYTLVDASGKPEFKIDGVGQFTPEEISAMVLLNMKQIAEKYLGQQVNDAVVTVPAYFTDAQRQATKDAGVIAGLNVVRVINEPTAAALAVGLDTTKTSIAGERNVLIFDLGGGTFDVSLLAVEDSIFEVIATNGDTRLGGEDFDQRVVDYFLKVFKKKHGVDLRSDTRAVQKLRREVEMAKRKLSNAHSTVLEIESISGGIDFSETLTRAKFEELNMDLFKRTMGPVKEVLKDANLDKTEIDEIVLVGGSTRIPKVQSMVKEFFGKEPIRGVNPDEAVAMGAAIQGSIIAGDVCNDDVVIIDSTSLNLGIETVGGLMTVLIAKNTAMPTKKTQIFSTAADNQERVTISVFEGQRTMVKDNHLLGKFDLSGIAPAPRGQPQIEVTFNVDVNGIFHVSAKDLGSAKEESLEIGMNDRLSSEEVEKMMADAAKWEKEDEANKERIEAFNQLEGAAYQTKNMLKDEEKSSQLNEADKEIANRTVDDLIGWLDSNKEADATTLTARKSEFDEALKSIFGDAAGSARDEL